MRVATLIAVAAETLSEQATWRRLLLLMLLKRSGACSGHQRLMDWQPVLELLDVELLLLLLLVLLLVVLVLHCQMMEVGGLLLLLLLSERQLVLLVLVLVWQQLLNCLHLRWSEVGLLFTVLGIRAIVGLFVRLVMLIVLVVLVVLLLLLVAADDGERVDVAGV